MSVKSGMGLGGREVGMNVGGKRKGIEGSMQEK